MQLRQLKLRWLALNHDHADRGGAEMSNKREVGMTSEVGLDIEWHVEDGKLVIDKSNVPISDELANAMCPQWVREAMTKKESK